MAKQAAGKVLVSERALFSRINRVLLKDGETIRRCRTDSRSYHNLGSYYTVDFSRNAVVDSMIDLEEYGREIGVLRPFEAMADQ